MQKSKNSSASIGFTIVEISVVIVVIGILAMLGMVGYGSWRTNVASNEVKSDLSSVGAAMESVRNFGSGYPLAIPDTYNASPNVTVTYTSGDTSAYCIDGVSKVKSSVRFFIDTTRTGGEPKKGTCATGEQVDPTPGWSQIKGGGEDACGIRDGAVYCWGWNRYGQNGNGTMTTSLTPVPVDATGVLSGKTITQLESGGGHSCVIADARAYCWGRDDRGQLGAVGSGDQLVPVAVDTSGVLNGKNVTDITVAGSNTCVIADSLPYCWGDNYDGQVGINRNYESGGSTTVHLPTAVITSGALNGKVVTDIDSAGGNTCAVASGQAYCWGSNNYGQTGSGFVGFDRLVPTAINTSGVLNGKTVTAIKAGGRICVIADGAAYCWGLNTDGLLGNNSTTDSIMPVAVNTSGVLNGKTVTALSGSCAIADGAAYCWGPGVLGKLGNNSTVRSLVPVAVDTSGVLNGKTITGIASAGRTTHVTTSDGNGYYWGEGPYGSNAQTTGISLVPRVLVQ